MIKWGCRHPSDQPQVVHGHRVCGAPACALIGARVRIYDFKNKTWREEERDDDQVEEISSFSSSDEEPEVARKRAMAPSRSPSPVRQARRHLAFTKEGEEKVYAHPSLPEIPSSPDEPIAKHWHSSPQQQDEYRRKILLDPWQHNGDYDRLDSHELKTWILDPILERKDEAQDLQFLSTVIHYFNQGAVYQRLIPNSDYYHKVLDATCNLYLHVLLFAFNAVHTDFLLIPQRYDRADEWGSHTFVSWNRVSRGRAIEIEREGRPKELWTPQAPEEEEEQEDQEEEFSESI